MRRIIEICNIPWKYVFRIMSRFKMNITTATQNMIYDRCFNPKPHHVANIFRLKYFKMCVLFVDPFVEEKGRSNCWENAKQPEWFSFWHSASFHCVITYKMTGMRWHASMCLHTHYDYTKIPTVSLPNFRKLVCEWTLKQ